VTIILLLEQEVEQIFAMSDDNAECASKIGGITLRSIGDVSRYQRLKDNDEESVFPKEMPIETLWRHSGADILFPIRSRNLR
jgi:DNA-binding ferritin-like protein